MEPFYFHHPTTISISGPSNSGKTSLVIDIINNKEELFDPIPIDIYIFFSEEQPLYNKIKYPIKLIHGIPDQNICKKIVVPSLFIIDDNMEKIDQVISNIFTKYAHHKNLSVILIMQNYYNKNEFQRTININTTYNIFMKNPRNKLAVMQLAKEAFPGNTKYVMESYVDATIDPFSYLVIDLRQETSDDLRLITNIIPQKNKYQTFYVPIKDCEIK